MFYACNSTLILYFAFFLTCFSTTVVFFAFDKFTALPSSALLFVFYCIVKTFVFRVTARLEDTKPVTLQHPWCLFQYFTWCVLLIINLSNKNKINRSFVLNTLYKPSCSVFQINWKKCSVQHITYRTRCVLHTYRMHCSISIHYQMRNSYFSCIVINIGIQALQIVS